MESIVIKKLRGENKYSVWHENEGIVAYTTTKQQAVNLKKRLKKEKSQMFGYF